jgi:gluconolactonase
MNQPVRECRPLAEGLSFPDGPVAMADGSIVLVEIAQGVLTRIDAQGQATCLARPGGGPNGIAIGPDGALYVCNNGGESFAEAGGLLLPMGRSPDYRSGRIERVDPVSGHVDVLYTEVGGRGLRAPNDLVFDEGGGMWFTDSGHSDRNSREHGAICYALPDGSSIRDVLYPCTTPNGIGISPDGQTLYVAELLTARLIAFPISGPGELDVGSQALLPGRLVGACPGRCFFDSLALEECGYVCVAAPLLGAIVVLSPAGDLVEIVAVPDPLPTNICFGGPGLRTGYITLAGRGSLVAMDWLRPGQSLHFAS